MMKALTIWQPWASLIMLGAKPYEFRGWHAPNTIVGQRIAIHAGARKPRRAEIADIITRINTSDAWTTCIHMTPDTLRILDAWHANPGKLYTGCILGTAILGEPKKASEIVGEFGGVVNDSDRDEHFNWAWPLSDPHYLREPLPMKGMQGFWNVELGGAQ